MKTAKLRINYGITINLGNHESKRIDVSMEIEIEEHLWENESIILFGRLKLLVDNELSEQ